MVCHRFSRLPSQKCVDMYTFDIYNDPWTRRPIFHENSVEIGHSKYLKGEINVKKILYCAKDLFPNNPET